MSKIGGKENEHKKLPVYIDSPLATKATEIFKANALVFDEEARAYIVSGDNPLEFENLHFTHSAEESKALNFSDEPKIIISASGMCDAGRIKHHLKHNLWKKECSVVFVGYQAEGTLGRRIMDGEKDVKILGEEIHINAEIYNVEGFSGHADKPALMKWLGGFKEKPKNVFIVHGETESKKDFAKDVTAELELNCIIPEYNRVYDIKPFEHIHEIKLVDKEKSVSSNEITIEIDKVIEKANDDQINNLTKDVAELKKLFDNALKLTEGTLKKDMELESLNKINNNIIEIEN
jgi:metallo-beta-lactamase family protein